MSRVRGTIYIISGCVSQTLRRGRRMNTHQELETAEYEITRMRDGRCRARFYLFQARTEWRAPKVRVCTSEDDAMNWINSKLNLHGHEAAYALHTDLIK